MAAQRIVRHLRLAEDLDAAAEVLAWSPGLLPIQYTGCSIELAEGLIVRFDRRAPAFADGAWPSLLEEGHLEPLDAIVLAVNPRLRCEVLASTEAELVIEVVQGVDERPTSQDVRLTEFSTGADFAFEERGTPVEIRFCR